MITSTAHPLVKTLYQVVRNKKARQEENLLVIDGDKIIFELAKEGKILYFLTADLSLIPKEFKEIPYHHVSKEVIDKISTCQTPPLLLGVAALPKPSALQNNKWVLVLDRLQDPGNVGTLIRTAHALGWDGVFLIDPSCDLFNDKALRASRGAAIHLHYRFGTYEEMIDLAVENDSLPATADLQGAPPEPQKKSQWLILGSEGQGLHHSLHKIKKYSIPMKEGVESLNVSSAGSILLYALKSKTF